jgi:hypothetical protein
MTRWILLVLLIANLGYFGWNQWRPAPGAAPERIEAPVRNGDSGEVPALRLVSETGEGHASTLDDVAPSPGETSAPASAEESPAAPQADTTTAEEEPGPPEGLDERLLAWMDQDCVLVAPLESAQLAGELETALRDRDLPAGRESRRVLDRTLYWVYIAPAASRQEALEASRAIRDQGIDNFIIESDLPIRNGISLGVFNEGDSADRHVAAMQRRGLNPEIYADEKYEDRLAVRVQPVTGTAQFSRLAQALAAAFGPTADWPLRSCQPIATTAALD